MESIITKGHISSRALSGTPGRHCVPAAPNKALNRTRPFTCDRVELQVKNGENERKKALHKKYTINSSLQVETQKQKDPFRFVTKVQIRKIKTPTSQSTNDEPYGGKNSKNNGDVQKGNLPNGCSLVTSDVPSLRNTVELLWLDTSLKLADEERAEEMRLVHSLSRQLSQHRLLLRRTRQERPTASFAAPTKGEISLLMQNPDFKRSLIRDRCHGHKLLMMSRGRTISLPFSNQYTVNSSLSTNGTEHSSRVAYVKEQGGYRICTTSKR